MTRPDRLRALLALRSAAEVGADGAPDVDLVDQGLAILDTEIDAETRTVAIQQIMTERQDERGGQWDTARRWAERRVDEHPEEIADAVRRAGL